MTLTERNEKLQDLRKKLAWLRTEELAVEQSIRQINQDYRDQQLFKDKNLFDQMFEVSVG
tara:strand:- start:82 stop:261 length:180 start_codon:yes stop_codon:yes gene_type:complete